MLNSSAGRFRRSLVLTFLLGALAGCEAAKTPAPAKKVEQVELVEIQPPAPEIYVGQGLLLEALPTDRRGEDLGPRPAIWASSDESVATVGPSGLVEGIAPGEVRITATIEEVEGSVLLVVIPTPLGRVVLEPSFLDLRVGEQQRLEAQVLDLHGVVVEGVLVAWASSAPEVAVVDEEGRVEARGPGLAKISARIEELEGEVVVQVVEARLERLERLEIEETSLSLYTGRSVQLEVEVYDVNGDLRPEVEVSWVSTAPMVANVGASGLLRGWSPGEATIIASAMDLELEIEVTVSRMPVVRLEVEPGELVALQGEEIALLARVFGPDESPMPMEPVEWSSSDEELATVDQNGIVEARQRGEVIITATAGGFSAATSLTIRRSPPVKGIQIQASISVPSGSSRQLHAQIFDVDDELVEDLSPEWSSSDPAVASVDRETGLLHTYQSGQTHVTVGVEDVSATALIHVYDPVSRVVIVGDSSDFFPGENRQWIARIFDPVGGLTDQFPAQWSSSDEQVATVSEGIVQPLAAGEATISLEAEGKQTSLQIRVKDELRFSKIQARGDNICALTIGGELYCWGGTLHQTGGAITLTQPYGGGSFRDLGVGDRHVCVIDQGSRAFCGGANEFGQLGDGTSTHSPSSFVSVVGGLLFRSISAGSGLSCGVTLGSKAYCWGSPVLSSESGELIVSPIPEPLSGELEFSSITRSGYGRADYLVVSCGLTLDHRAYCWGWNDSGELGDGSRLSSMLPVPVSGDLRFSFLSASNFSYLVGNFPDLTYQSYGHGCGVTLAGEGYCWGANAAGELGIGIDSAYELGPKKVVGDQRFKEIHTHSSSESYGPSSSCGITVEGSALCWGRDKALLPAGTSLPQRIPMEIPGGIRFESLTTGNGLACGMSSDGKAYCWGNNQSRRLGVHDLDPVVTVPSLVIGQAPELGGSPARRR